jgi:hypothetical protein
MQPTAAPTGAAVAKKTRHRCDRHDIPLPDGDVLTPRKAFAEETIGVSERTVMRMNLPTVYLSNVAFVKQRASLQIIADRAERKNQPSKRHRT